MLKGKTALITGSTSGIGLAYAHELAKNGANIMLNGFGDASEIEKTRAAMATKYKVEVAFNGADLLQPEQIENLIKDTEKKFSAIDILINNAGIQHVAPIEDFPIEKWQAIIGLNLSAAFYAMRAAIPGMKKNGWGRIINTASAHALVASPFKSAYVAAKHGLAGLTKTAGLELATHKITVNAICPGYVWTPLVEKQIPDTAKARGISEQEVIETVMLAGQPTKKFVTVEQVAALALFLCSDAAEQITGTLHSIDGGWTAE